MLGQTESKKSSFKLPCPSSDVSFLAFLSSCCWLVVFALVAPFYLTRYLLHNAPYVPCHAKGIYNYKTFYFVELSTTGISWWKHRHWVNHKEDSCRKTSKTDFRYLYWAALTFISSVVRKLQGWFFPFFFLFSCFCFCFFFNKTTTVNVSYFVGRNGWQKVVMQLNWTVLSRLIPANPRIAVVERELEDVKCNAVNECGCNMPKKSSGRYETLTRSSYIARSKRLTEVVITYEGRTGSYQVVWKEILLSHTYSKIRVLLSGQYKNEHGVKRCKGMILRIYSWAKI